MPDSFVIQAPHPWDFPGKNPGAGCDFLPQRIFPTQRIQLVSPALQIDSLPLSHLGSQWATILPINLLLVKTLKTSGGRGAVLCFQNLVFRELSGTCKIWKKASIAFINTVFFQSRYLRFSHYWQISSLLSSSFSSFLLIFSLLSLPSFLPSFPSSFLLQLYNSVNILSLVPDPLIVKPANCQPVKSECTLKLLLARGCQLWGSCLCGQCGVKAVCTVMISVYGYDITFHMLRLTALKNIFKEIML